jgi:hypothetical protein
VRRWDRAKLAWWWNLKLKLLLRIGRRARRVQWIGSIPISHSAGWAVLGRESVNAEGESSDGEVGEHGEGRTMRSVRASVSKTKRRSEERKLRDGMADLQQKLNV